MTLVLHGIAGATSSCHLPREEERSALLLTMKPMARRRAIQ